jgi:DNA-binding LytR/AlgR family response regulator
MEPTAPSTKETDSRETVSPIATLGAALTLGQGDSSGTRRLMERFPMLRVLGRRRPQRVAIKVKRKIIFIDPGDVVAVQADGNYVLLQRASSSYLLRESISVVAEKLERYGFIRIHRSVLVNTMFVEEISPHSTGEYGLRVKGGKEYTVTRTYKKNLKCLAEFWIGTGAFLPD